MRLRIILGVLACSFLFAACERSFDSPPPVPVVEGFSPAHAFAGDLIDIQVSNPGVAGELAVYFGTAKAEILSSGGNGATVKVPVLETGASVPIQVSTSGGQADSGESLFVYDGHGHPLQQVVIQNRSSRVSPRAVFTAPNLGLGIFGYINADSKQIGLVLEELSLHADTGICGSPLSAAASNYPGEEGGVQFWITIIRENLSLEDQAPSALFRMGLIINPETDDLELESFQSLSVPTDVGEPDFVPLAVFTLCDNPVCLAYREAVTDLQEARIGLLEVVPMNETPPVTILELGPGNSSLCDPGEAPGYFVDLTQDQPTGDIYAAVNDSPEIWRLALDQSSPERIWPVQGAEVECEQRIAAIAVNPSRNNLFSDLRLFVAYSKPPKVLALEKDPASGVWSNTAPLRQTFLDGIPFAMTTGQYRDDANEPRDRLYVMTTSGLRGYDVDDGTLTEILSLPGDVALGWPQALATDDKFRIGNSKPDTIIWADTEGDSLRTWEVGREMEVQHELPVGTFAPSLARSPSQPYDYLTDPFTNAIRVLDRDSAAQVGQFGIDGNQTYGTSSLATLKTDNMELLFIPKPRDHGDPDDPDDPDTNGPMFNGLLVRRIDGDRALPDCASSLLAGETTDPNLLSLFVDVDRYDRFRLVTKPPSESDLDEAPKPEPLLIFIRNANEDTGVPGMVWTRLVDQKATSFDSGIVIADREKEKALNTRVLQHGLDEKKLVVAFLLKDQGDNVPPLIVSDMLDDKHITYEVSDLFQTQTSAIAVLRREGEEDTGPEYTVYFALGHLGQVRALTLRQDNSLVGDVSVATGGVPSAIFVSPDRRRLYVTHHTQSMVSIINIDDSATGLDLQTNLSVAAYPNEIVFSPDGGQALITHFYNGHQTVIE